MNPMPEQEPSKEDGWLYHVSADGRYNGRWRLRSTSAPRGESVLVDEPPDSEGIDLEPRPDLCREAPTD